VNGAPAARDANTTVAPVIVFGSAATNAGSIAGADAHDALGCDWSSDADPTNTHLSVCTSPAFATDMNHPAQQLAVPPPAPPPQPLASSMTPEFHSSFRDYFFADSRARAHLNGMRPTPTVNRILPPLPPCLLPLGRSPPMTQYAGHNAHLSPSQNGKRKQTDFEHSAGQSKTAIYRRASH
jgi:hypothetical protein